MLKGIEWEPYRPGQQKIPLLALTLLTVGGFFLSRWSAAHIKHHMINVVSHSRRRCTRADLPLCSLADASVHLAHSRRALLL
jgi:hypothetical protein